MSDTARCDLILQLEAIYEERDLGRNCGCGYGSGVGAVLGSSIGVVGAFGGIAATLPLAVVVGLVGYGFAKIRNLRKENARLKALIAEDMNKTL